MADTTALKNRIRAAIKANDNQEITGPVLQQSLLDIVDELNGATETEASQRQNGDNTLQQGINTERQRAQEAEQALSQAINDEIQRAQGVEQNLQNKVTEIVGINQTDTINVVQGQAFSHIINVSSAQGRDFNFTFIGTSCFDDVVAVYLNGGNVPLLNISTDGNYTISLPNNAQTLTFFRNAPHVVSSGNVIIRYGSTGILQEEVAAEKSRAEGVEQNLSRALINLRNAGYAFGGIAVTDTNPGIPSGNCFYIVRGAGTYQYFRNADDEPIILNRDGIYVLTYESVENNYWEYNPIIYIDNTRNNSLNLITNRIFNEEITRIVGISRTDTVNVTQGQVFSHNVNISEITSDSLSFRFTGTSCFDDVVGVLIDDTNPPVLNISSDGDYTISLPSGAQKLTFFRNALNVVASGVVTIAFESSGGLLDEKIGIEKLRAESTEQDLSQDIKNVKYRNALQVLSESVTAGGHITMVDGNIVITQTAQGHVAGVIDILDTKLCPEYALIIKAKCNTGTQSLVVGNFASSEHSYAKFITIDTTDKYYITDLDFAYNNPNGYINIGILSDNINIGNTVTISEAFIIPAADIKYAKNLINNGIRLFNEGTDTIQVTQSMEFRHTINTNSGLLQLTFAGTSCFDDVVAVYKNDTSVILIEISTDGVYNINIDAETQFVTFFRNAPHVVNSGEVTIAYKNNTQLGKETSKAITEGIDKTLNVDSPILTSEVIRYANVLIQSKSESNNSIVIRCNAASYTGGIQFTDCVLGDKNKIVEFDIVGLDNNQPMIVGDAVSSITPKTVRFNIGTSSQHFKFLFPKTATQYYLNFVEEIALSTKSITISNLVVYEVSDSWLNYFCDNKQIENAMMLKSGITAIDSVAVTQGQAFLHKISLSGHAGDTLKFRFTGMSLFDDVVAVYNEDVSTPVLNISEDGDYEVAITSWETISFFRNAPHVIDSGTVTITYGLDNNISPQIEEAIRDIVNEVVPPVVADEPDVYKVEDFFNRTTRNQKYLTRIGFLGDSLTANEVGGDIPQALDEGDTMRPMRLLTNNIPRRFYDKASWNKPTFRRLDNSNWTKNGFNVITGEQIFWGISEVYHKAESAEAYAEITIPDGYEHFAIICRTKSGYGSLNVKINNSNPSTILYDNPIIDDAAVTGAKNGNPKSTLIYKLNNNQNVNTDDCSIQLPCGIDSINLGIGVGQGNPYAIYEYNNLPSGDNVVRISAASATRVDLWGIFYWSGNSMVVMNMAYGGHSTTSLLSVYRDVVFNDNVHFDELIFELPIMNDSSPQKVGNVETTKQNVQTLINNLDTYNNDVLFTTCHPLGLSIVHDTNFYVDNIDFTRYPSMEQVSEAARLIVLSNKKPFIDLFRIFKKLIISKGGTLEGGESGLWYTWDGQHPNLACCEIWFSNLWANLKNKPLMIE